MFTKTLHSVVFHLTIRLYSNCMINYTKPQNFNQSPSSILMSANFNVLAQYLDEQWIAVEGTNILASGENDREPAIILELFHPKQLLSKQITFRRTKDLESFLAPLRVPGLSLAE